MKNFTPFQTEYLPVHQKLFPRKPFKSTEKRQLKKYAIDKEINLSIAASEIKFCKTLPTLVSLFVLDNVYIYDILTDSLITKFPQISNTITTGELRQDGKVIFSGTETGAIIIHDIINKNCLRNYQSHSLEINCIDINENLINFISCSKDCSFKHHELSSKKPIREYLKAHNDYIKTCRYFNDNIVITGGYDKVIKMWDIREESNTSSSIFDNKSICEDIVILKNTDYFIATSDNSLILYDIRKFNESVNNTIPIQSTITKLIPTINNQRLFIVPANESFVKVVDISDLSMRSIYSLNLKEKIFSFDISNDMNHFAVGYESGNVIIKSKKTKEDIEEIKPLTNEQEDYEIELLDPSKYAEKTIAKNYRYFNRGQYIKKVEEGDLFIKKEKKKKLQKHDVYLKKFQYHKALDSVLKGNNVEVIVGVIEELIDRNALKIALLNRSENDVEMILKFILWKIRDTKVMDVMINVFDLMVNYYITVAHKNEKIQNLFNQIHSEIEREINFEMELNEINKEIESISRVYKVLN